MKPGRFVQIYIQLVFAVKHRDAALSNKIRDQVFRYMSGIINQMGHKTILINGTSDHVHVFFGQNPSISISDTVHDLKRNSSLYINNEKLCQGNFAWQEGYGAFSYHQKDIDRICTYIQDQEIHHRKRTFREEYLTFLEESHLPYEPGFLFDFFE